MGEAEEEEEEAGAREGNAGEWLEVETSPMVMRYTKWKTLFEKVRPLERYPNNATPLEEKSLYRALEKN